MKKSFFNQKGKNHRYIYFILISLILGSFFGAFININVCALPSNWVKLDDFESYYIGAYTGSTADWSFERILGDVDEGVIYSLSGDRVLRVAKTDGDNHGSAFYFNSTSGHFGYYMKVKFGSDNWGDFNYNFYNSTGSSSVIWIDNNESVGTKLYYHDCFGELKLLYDYNVNIVYYISWQYYTENLVRYKVYDSNFNVLAEVNDTGRITGSSFSSKEDFNCTRSTISFYWYTADSYVYEYGYIYGDINGTEPTNLFDVDININSQFNETECREYNKNIIFYIYQPEWNTADYYGGLGWQIENSTGVIKDGGGKFDRIGTLPIYALNIFLDSDKYPVGTYTLWCSPYNAYEYYNYDANNIYGTSYSFCVSVGESKQYDFYFDKDIYFNNEDISFYMKNPIDSSCKIKVYHGLTDDENAIVYQTPCKDGTGEYIFYENVFKIDIGNSATGTENYWARMVNCTNNATYEERHFAVTKNLDNTYTIKVDKSRVTPDDIVTITVYGHFTDNNYKLWSYIRVPPTPLTTEINIPYIIWDLDTATYYYEFKTQFELPDVTGDPTQVPYRLAIFYNNNKLDNRTVYIYVHPSGTSQYSSDLPFWFDSLMGIILVIVIMGLIAFPLRKFEVNNSISMGIEGGVMFFGVSLAVVFNLFPSWILPALIFFTILAVILVYLARKNG